MAKYLLQKGAHSVMGALEATVYDLVAGENSFRGEGIHQTCICERNRVGLVQDIELYTPVGGIEFTEKALRLITRAKAGIDPTRAAYREFPETHITPINIPPQLQDDRFLRRKVLDHVPVERLAGAFETLGSKRLFIKSARRLKQNTTGIYDLSYLPVRVEDEYFVSQVVDNIESEWRCFVFNGEVMDIRRYMGSPWSKSPSKTWVEAAIKAYGDAAPAAYTLDLGVTDEGNPFVIEVHNFVSCGLYGFEDPVILRMLRAGFQREVQIALDEYNK